MSVRAKFYVGSKETTGSNIPNSVNMTKVSLLPVMNGSEENKNFWKYTPTGKIELQTINDEAAQQFEVGMEYYIDFTPAVQESPQVVSTTTTFVCPDTLK